MRISVITVTFNALPALKKTMASVMGQVRADYEYIVVDGSSTDGTRDYLAQEAAEAYRWISEPDSGIYEAMNKGVRIARGDYCLFMNAGDCFVNSRVLSRIRPLLEDADIVLGNEIRVDEDGAIEGFSPSRGAFSLENLLQSSVSHQATFIRRELLIRHPYDESLRLVSDWKFILERFLEGGCRFQEVNEDVCFFAAGGATDKNNATGVEERLSVLSAYPQYRPIWQSPYRPSFFKKALRKGMLYFKKLQYALS